MMIRIEFLLALSILALAGCAPPSPDAGEFDSASMESEIQEFSALFWDAWRGGSAGLDRAMAFFDDHPDFTYAAQGTVWRSVPEVHETFRMAFQTIESQTIEIQETVIQVLDQDAAHLVQRGAYSMTDADGVTSDTVPFAFSGLLVRTASGWKIRSVHVSEPGVVPQDPSDPDTG